MTDIGNYRVERISKSRTIAIDMFDVTMKRHHVKGLIEPDVTDARSAVRRSGRDRDEGGSGAGRISFTAWLIKCISKAAEEHPGVHALRRGKRVFIFEDVDISTLIEVESEGRMVPLPYVVRKTNTKTVEEISAEIDTFKKSRKAGHDLVLGDAGMSKMISVYLLSPGFARRLFWKALVRMPLTLKRFGGTIVTTSVGMFGKSGGWALTFGLQSLVVAIGGIARKPAVTPDGIMPREFLDLTVLIDHDVIDGAPAARFVARLIELIEGAYGLDAYKE